MKVYTYDVRAGSMQSAQLEFLFPPSHQPSRFKMDASQQPLVVQGPLTQSEWITAKLAEYFRDVQAEQGPDSSPDAILAVLRGEYARLELEFLNGVAQQTPLLEFSNVENYFSPRIAKRLLLDHMTDNGFFTNYVGCVMYMQSTEKSIPKVTRPITLGGSTTRVTQKHSRLTVMAYHT